MARIETWYEQDLQKPVRVHNFKGSFFSGDASANRVGVVVTNNGAAATLSGSATGYFMLANGTTATAAGTITGGNKVYVNVPATAYSVPGPITVTIKLTDGSVVTTLLACVGIVVLSRTDIQPASPGAITDWTNQISSALQEVTTIADNVGQSIAEDYDSLSQPIEVGTYAMHNGLLYCCKTRITDDATFVASHWRQCNVTEELTQNVSDLKSALNIDEDNFFDVTAAKGKNLFNPRQLLKVNGITETEGVYSATAGNFASAFPSTSNGLIIAGGFKGNTRYTLSMQIKNTGSDTASGWGIKFEILYTDGTKRDTSVNKNVTSFASRTLISEANKTISKIYITAPSSPNNTWEIKEIQIEEGSSATSYEAFDLIAVDDTAREDISEIQSTLQSGLYYDTELPVPVSGYIKYSDGSVVGSVTAHHFVIANKGYKKVRVYCYSESSVLASVAFYSTKQVSTSGYIKASSKNYTTLGEWSYVESDVPANAQIIVLCSGLNTENDKARVQFPVNEQIIEVEGAEDSNIDRLAYSAPFNLERYMDHLFIEQVTSVLTQNIIIPCQSVFHVAISARLGFKFIEANVQATATAGKYIVTHGESEKLGRDFEDLNGESARGVSIAGTSYEELRNNYRYISQLPQYKVPPTSLEEFLYACRENGMFPILQYRDETMLQIARGIVGDNMILYQGNHIVFNGITTSYHSLTTKAEILAKCAENGKPYIYSMGNPRNFTDAELIEIVNDVHNAGYYIGLSSAYSGETQAQRCYKIGFDVDTVDKKVPVFEVGNLATLAGGLDFASFTTNGTAANGKLTLATGKTLSTQTYSAPLVKYCIKIMFTGTLTIDNKSITSDGTQMIVLTGFRIHSGHSLWITATADSEITMLKYVVSSC